MKQLFFILTITLLLACNQPIQKDASLINLIIPTKKETKAIPSKIELDTNFVYLNNFIPNLKLDLKYLTNNNFVGQPITGYKANKAILTKQAAVKLAKVQQELSSKGLGLKIFDAYRPQKAVNHFIEWAKDQSDTITKHQYYPNVNKANLFEAGYISSHSGHSRGSTVDVTLINLKTGEEIDMGSPFDYFDEISHTFSKKVYPEQSANRKYLRNTMLKHGFYSYIEEWWHFTSWNEPFKNKYWDFDVE